MQQEVGATAWRDNLGQTIGGAVRRLLLIICLSFCSYALAEPSLQTSAKGSNQEQAKPSVVKHGNAMDLRGTYELPLVVEVRPSPNSEKLAEQKSEQESEKANLDRLTALSTVALAVITFFLALFTAFLWSSTRKLVEDAKQSSQWELRAYLSAQNFIYQRRPTANVGEYKYYFQFQWVNSGNTPTRNLQTHIEFILQETPLPLDFKFQDSFDDIGHGVVTSKGLVNSPFIPSMGVSPEDLLDVHHGNKFAYIWGWAKYRDVLPDTPKHITKFCVQIAVNGNPVVPSEDGKGVDFIFPIHHGNNCSDDECSQQTA